MRGCCATSTEPYATHAPGVSTNGQWRRGGPRRKLVARHLPPSSWAPSSSARPRTSTSTTEVSSREGSGAGASCTGVFFRPGSSPALRRPAPGPAAPRPLVAGDTGRQRPFSSARRDRSPADRACCGIGRRSPRRRLPAMRSSVRISPSQAAASDGPGVPLDAGCRWRRSSKNTTVTDLQERRRHRPPGGIRSSRDGRSAVSGRSGPARAA